MDLHIHTPASADYREPQVSFLDILTRAEESGLDVIAFTDHNTIAGYRKLQEEIQQLELLKSLNRIDKREQETLAEYERLRRNILLLPGFEFTAAFGFHIIGIFSPEINIRQIEHILLDLNVHAEKLDEGSSTMGATADVLTAYRLITEAGGIAIAAHANSTNGVAMRGFRFGGQTKIAYTQDPNLAALEVTDLNQKGRRTTAAFFSGTKPEYPRRMHVIQGSDAHRLRTDPSNKRNLGIGDRATEILIPELSFDAIRVLFQSNDFARSRPKWSASKDVFDFVQQAREEGPNIVQDFHESMTVRGGRLYAIIANICSFANSNGGTLFVGVHGDPKKVVVGISNPANAMRGLNKEINDRISPALSVQMDIQETKNKKVIRVLVPRGDDPPYAVDDNKIYVRDEAESALAVRDEIVQLVKRGYQQTVLTEKSGAQESEDGKENGVSIHPPRTGVEVVADEEREGTRYFTMRDLRNGNVVKNVTKSSARRLWAYAISQFISLPSDLSTATISWEGELGVLRARKVGNRKKFDLAQKTGEGIKLYFGVTEDGIHGEWRHIVGLQAA
ncbi:MAG: putative DNA binding domain-containing protein [Chloroflexi bacterium]|nr:putative DNA binding domain-containing protein [Chloroflexota bacterium]